MRIATSTVTNMATNSMGNAYQKYIDIMNKIASNKNFTKVSENVTDATKVLKLNDQLAQLDQYQSNIQAATNEMNLAYDTLGSVADEISSINSLIVEASNGTTTPDSAKAIATSIREKVETIKDKMNTKYLDNYIFAGSYTQDPAYATVTVDGVESIKYQGSSKTVGDRELTISQGTVFAYNVTGEEVFPADADGKDFFAKMKELDELLTADSLDYNKIRESLDVLKGATDTVTQMQGEISAKVSKLDSTKTINEDTITKLTENKVDIEEVDITKAGTELASAYTALQASYSVGTQILNGLSLLDFI